MKTKFWVFLCIISGICSGLLNAQENITDLERNKLIGKIKSISINHFKAIDKFGAIDKGEKLSIDSIIDYTLIKYNSKGNKTEEIYCEKVKKGVIHKTFNYNDVGQIFEIKYYLSNGRLDYKEIYNYNSIGQKINCISYNLDGSLKEKYFWKYDNLKNNIEFSKYYPNGSLRYKSVNQFDNLGNKIVEISYIGSGAMFAKYVYGYDIKKNIVKKSIYGYNNALYYDYTYDFDTNGNLIYEFDSISQKINTYEYEKNDKVKANENGFIFSYEYSYDIKGNWIKRIEYRGEAKIPALITERLIEYYE